MIQNCLIEARIRTIWRIFKTARIERHLSSFSYQKSLLLAILWIWLNPEYHNPTIFSAAPKKPLFYNFILTKSQSNQIKIVDNKIIFVNFLFFNKYLLHSISALLPFISKDLHYLYFHPSFWVIRSSKHFFTLNNC